MFVYLSKSWDYYFSRKFGKLENNKYSVIHRYIHGEEFMLVKSLDTQLNESIIKNSV